MKTPALFAWAFAYLLPAAGFSASDWPHWRGPHRDGIAPDSPPLLDTWPEGGPPLVWKAQEQIPNGRDGGNASPVIAEGKVFLYVHSQNPPEKVVLPTEVLKSWGWQEGVPPELAEKIEKRRGELGRKFWGRTPSAADRKAEVDAFVSELDPAQAKEFAEHIALRIGNLEFISWNSLQALAGSMYGAKSACCVDLRTGMTKWKHTFEKLEATSPILADGKIIASVNDPKEKDHRVTVMFRATPDTYEELGWLRESVADLASPTIAGGRLYLRLANGLACYDLRKQ